MSDEENEEEKTPAAEEIKAPIDERIRQLENEGFDKANITIKLYQEGYSTHEIMKRHLPLKVLKREKESPETSVLGAVEGAVKGTGFLQEFKDMVRAQIGRTRELTDEFYNLGLSVLLASLHKAGLSMDDFRKIASQEGPLREAFKKANDTVFKALEYYQSDLITRVENERDEARAFASLLEGQIEEVKKKIDPKIRLEKMVYNLVLLSGSVKVDPEALMSLVDKWLQLEVITAD